MRTMNCHLTQAYLAFLPLFICGVCGALFGGPGWNPPTPSSSEPPAPVTNVSCIADNFESMNCSWCPEVIPTPPTKWLMKWSAGSESGACNFGRCWCELGQLKPNVSYHMKFTIRNAYGTVKSVAVVRTSQHIVKLRPVRHLEEVSYTSMSVQLNWSEPEGYDPKWFDVVYELQCEGPWEDEPKVTVELTNNRTCLLTGLHPHTTYNVQVRSRPVAGHLWSDPFAINVTTAEVPPAMPPTIPSGSFWTQPCSENQDGCQNVMVFWQLIPEKYRDGIILGYEVSFRKGNGSTSSMSKVNTTLQSVTLPNLDGRHGYTINVQAYNSAGKSPAAMIFIPRREELSQLPVDIVAERNENKSHIFLSWAPSTVPVDNYTFLWCESLVNGQHGCQDPIQSRVVAGNVTELDHAVRKDGDMYALSANTNTGSSGMGKAWICVYDYYGLPGKQVFSFDSIGARNVSLSWQQRECSTTNRGRVLSYKLQLRNNNDEMLEEFELSATVDSYTISNLHPYTNYTIKMAAVAQVGHGEFSVKKVHTLESKPDDPPTNLEGHLISDHQVALSWSNPPRSNGVIREYEVIAKANGVGEWHEIVHGMNHTLEVYSGVTYIFTVVAINAIGRSPEATPITIVTPVRAPAQTHLDGVWADQVNVAMVMWSPPRPPNGPINNYIVQSDLRNEGHPTFMTYNDTVPGNETKMQIVVNCSDATIFMDVRVLAVNYNGTEPLYGNWSGAKTVALCGGATVWTWIIVISVVIVALIIAVLICSAWRYRRLVNKPLHVISPDRVPSERELIQGENDHSGTISPDATSIDNADMSAINATYSLTNNTSAATCNSSASNTPLMSHDAPCDVHYSGNERNGAGSYSKAYILSNEPDGPAASIHPVSNSPSSQYELTEIPTAGKTIDDAQEEPISRVDKDGAAICWNDSADGVKVCNGTANRPNNLFLQQNPVEVTVFTAARQPDTAAALSRDDQSASSETCL